ncbi:TPA: UDP-3-O-[3-hydroxymyristoyl] N-acetylglucosamine deacetylase [Candidatus Poribacteria bacterium]|nr:UDP-3-O-[3-hydroxymyristoyl] N-acetylglucosamine deacetylase [Candidatus Poribacteria bacterium]HEX30887.1 UDP-3-O-[3-hydroxymyristoyl] N-acetylglucosamine deacetylase [Candidatus Poribacteria bacterium]
MERQRTIKSQVTVSGVGLMLGKPVNLTLKPAGPDEGITFRRTDLAGKPSLKATFENFSDEIPHCTSLKNEDVRVVGVEHLLSALAGLGVDNVIVEMDAEEPPAGDGSAEIFVKAIRGAGLVELDSERRYINLGEEICISENGRQLIAVPSDTFKITFVFDHPKLPSQVVTFEITPDSYESEIGQARTFCFESEAQEIKSKGFGLGGSEENVILLSDDSCSPKGELRLPGEFARHKVLDLIGDLALLGARPKAHVIAIRSGHDFNIRLVERLVERRGWLDRPIEASEIYRVLPHRFPFMMVDRVLAIEPKRRIVAVKNVTYNETFFQGHFPGTPVMPAVLQVEALAQAGGYLLMDGVQEGMIGYFAAVGQAKFRRPVIPGDQLILEVEVLRLRSRFGKLRGVAKVKGEVATEAEFTITIGGR